MKRGPFNLSGTAALAPLLSLASLALGGPGCYPLSYDRSEDLDLVVTVRVEGADYTNNKTFALPDRVIDIGQLLDGGVRDRGPTPGDPHPRSDQILQRIRSNMITYGYTEETDPQNNPPDVVLLPGVVKTEWTVYTYYDWWGYWGWWPGWGYYPGWGPGWGYYYPPTIVGTTFKTGTLVIDMVDGKDRDEQNKRLKPLWLATINGVVSGSAASIDARLDRTIDQAFSQSAYLKQN
jgi:hypothetical protein